MAMIELGVGLTGAVMGVMAAEFGRTRRRGLPAYGWAGLGVLVVAEVMMFRGIEPVARYFTPIAWTAYILIADAAVLAIRGRSRLANAAGRFAGLAFLSIPLWLTFEIYNLRLQNWTYVGVPKGWAEALFGYAWSFATIWPAIFETADLVEAFGWFRKARPIELSLRAEKILAGTGAVMLVLPVVLPQRIGAYLFALVWLGFVLLLDPVNRWKGWPSILGDFREGRRGRLWSLLISGWVCGWLWEFWNYWAAAKWHYIFPMFQHWKIFEMPAPGFFGFPPFAVECFTMYVFAAGMLKWRGEE
jgi:hypothetical protein